MPTSPDKPYKVYRQTRKHKGDGSISWDTLDTYRKPPKKSGGGRGPGRSGGKVRRGFRYLRRTVYVFVLIAGIWLTVAFLAFQSAVEKSNERVPQAVRKQLAPTNGPVLTSARNILLVGSDRREGDVGRADTLIVVRVDVKRRQFAMLSIPRDLRVEIPGGFGTDKINAAYPLGEQQAPGNGGALVIQTVENATGLSIHHYAEIDFQGFRTLIDEIGGVTIDNPRAVRSAEPFDGQRWFFPKGELTLSGRYALAYARVRKNALDPTESDLTRAYRQQAVINAVADKVLSTNTLLHPRDVPIAIVGPLTTDITAGQMVSMGFGRWWATDENTLRCRLGGEDNGDGSLLADEHNPAVVQMFEGRLNPVAPDIVTNPFDAGCTAATEAP